MNREAVQRAVIRAIDQAFTLGAKAKKADERAAQAQALQYADSLVMPMIDLALAQALEEGAIAAAQARLDPEPDMRPAAFP